MVPIASLSQSTLPLDWTAQLAGLEVNYTAFQELMSSDAYEKRVLAHDFNQDGALDFMVLRCAPEGSGLPPTNVFGRRQNGGGWVQSGRVWHLEGESPVGNFTAGAFGDFDGDGWDDRMVGSSESGRICNREKKERRFAKKIPPLSLLAISSLLMRL